MQSSTAGLNAGTAGCAAPERTTDEMRQWTNGPMHSGVFGDTLADVNLEGNSKCNWQKKMQQIEPS